MPGQKKRCHVFSLSAFLTCMVFFCLVIAVFLPACAKKVIPPPPPPDLFPDTVYPTSYLPAWPGSWWKYVSEKGDTSKIETYREFVKDVMNFGDHLEEAYVPLYDGFPLWGNWLRLDVRGVNKFVRVVTDSLEVGSKWYAGGYSASGGYTHYLTLLNKDTSIDVAGKSFPQVVVLRHSMSQGSQPEYSYGNLYYARGIGLVRQEVLYSSDSVRSFRNLCVYHISR